MHDVECTLLSYSFFKDEYGNVLVDEKGREKKEVIRKPIPLIRVENIYKSEFYVANQHGRKPSLRLVVSSLNYDDEEELIYMNKEYTVIRTEEGNVDEKILICERKISNVKQ